MKNLTPCKLKEIVHEEARKLHEIGWDNLPDGWDEDSLDSFARSLTDKTQDDSEGFFTACMDEVEDKFDDPEAFCASLKDEYLDTTDWRGESVNKSNSMKLTESKLRSIVRNEARKLFSEAVEDYDQFEYKLKEIRRDNLGNGLALAFKLLMAPANPDDTGRVKQVEQQVTNQLERQFRLMEVAEVYVTGQDMLMVHLKNGTIGANTAALLMDEGIKIDLTR